MRSRKIVAVFDTQEAAQSAKDRLHELGLPAERISVVNQSSSEHPAGTSEGHRGGFWAHIKEVFMPDQDRATLDESLRRGGYVLAATVGEDQAEEVTRLLENSGAVDLEQRQAEWRASGWNGTPARVASGERTAEADSGEQVIPVVEEQLRVGKREVNRGGVRVRSFIVEEPVHEEVRLREERVEVERRPVQKPARSVPTGSSADLLQEQTIELSATGEEAVVAKDAVITEEVRLRKTAEERVEQVDDTVRRTEVEVDDGRGNVRRPGTPPDLPRSRGE